MPVSPDFPSPKKIPFVFFDVDDTLYERSQPFVLACEKIFAPNFTLDWKGVFEARCRYGDEVFEASQNGAMTLEESYIYRITHAFRDFGREVSAEEALTFERCFAGCLDQISLEPGIDKVLQYLVDNGIPAAILTNGPASHQRRKLISLGVSRWIPEKYWCISGEMDAAKPHPEIFRKAEQILHCTPDASWLIGDSYFHDVEGAAAAGWHSIWYTRKFAAPPEKILPAQAAPGNPAELLSAVMQLCQV